MKTRLTKTAYDVVICDDMQIIYDYFAKLIPSVSSIFIITDTNLAPISYSLLGSKLREQVPCYSVSFEAGEQSKNYSTIEDIYEALLAKHADRNSLLVAFGGGVTGDITGFVASTYKRGIRYIQIPTSLIAQIDSAYGGKTGYDVGQIKNAVGTFYEPIAVLSNIKLLETLPKSEQISGEGEFLKYQYLMGEPLYAKIDAKSIEKCVQYKLGVVSEDPFDKSMRHLLNFGHTIGHAIELSYGFSHGVSIAYGAYLMLKISELDGNHSGSNAFFEAMQKAGIEHFNFEYNRIAGFILNDKKAEGDTIKVAYPIAPGNVVVKSLQVSDLLDKLKEVL